MEAYHLGVNLVFHHKVLSGLGKLYKLSEPWFTHMNIRYDIFNLKVPV